VVSTFAFLALSLCPRTGHKSPPPGGLVPAPLWGKMVPFLTALGPGKQFWPHLSPAWLPQVSLLGPIAWGHFFSCDLPRVPETLTQSSPRLPPPCRALSCASDDFPGLCHPLPAARQARVIWGSPWLDSLLTPFLFYLDDHLTEMEVTCLKRMSSDFPACRLDGLELRFSLVRHVLITTSALWL
jgi:hypothetical protein